jgi:tyrosine-protein kinase Etk/Wzc
MSDSQNINSADWQGDQNSLNLKRVIGTVLSFWPRFVGCVIITLLIAFLYLRYTIPVYNIRAKIILQDDKSEANLNSSLFKGLGVGNTSNSIDNEIEILKSHTLMESVAKELQLNVRYYTKGRIKSLEIYNGKPFNFVLVSEDSLGNRSGSYKINATPGGFVLKSLDKTYTGKWGDTVELPIGKVYVARNMYVTWEKNEDYLITVSNLESAIAQYMASMNIALTNKQVSSLSLVIKDNLPEKGEIILNKLIDIYLKKNVTDKERIANNTIAFIEERLDFVGKELYGTEDQIENFKKANINYVGNTANFISGDAHTYENSVVSSEI